MLQTTPPIKIPDPQGYLYIVTDSHLDQSLAPYKEFITMLSQLEEPQVVICLGDLFKVWLALPQFWTPLHKEVMKGFESLKNQSVEIIFVIGNREGLLPRKWNDYWRTRFPFTHLIYDQGSLSWGNLHYGLTHGDAINRQDTKHLYWRKIVRSRGFEWFFRMIPSVLAHKIVNRLEASMAESNMAFKIEFPEEEVLHFAKNVLHEVDHYFIGHFHLDREIKLPNVKGKLRIVPDWQSQRSVLRIDPRGLIQTFFFKDKQFYTKAEKDQNNV